MNEQKKTEQVSVSDLEEKFFEVINEWLEEYEGDSIIKRDILGLLLMRLLSCVIATTGSPIEIGHLISDFESQLTVAVNLVTNNELPNPIKNLGE